MLKFFKIDRVWAILTLAGVRLRDLVIPSLFAAIASFFEGASLALLIPALHGIITRDVSFVLSLPGFKHAASALGITNGSDPYVIIVVVAAAFISAFTRIGFQLLSSLFTMGQVKKFADNLRGLIFERLLSFGKLYFDRSSAGQTQEVMTTYVTYVSHMLTSFQRGLYAICTLAVYVAILFVISWKVTLAAVALFPLLFISVRSLLDKISGSSHEFVHSFNELARQIGNSLASIPLVKAYSTERMEGERFRQLSGNVAGMEYQIERRGLFVSPLQEVVLLMFLFVLVSFVSVVILSNPSLNIASYAVYLLILKRAAALCNMINSIRSAMAGVSGPIEQILSLFDDTDKHFVPSGDKAFQGLKDGIEFRKLSFQYPDGAEALQGVSFVIEKGKSLALVGESGSGKSTLISLLMRFYDCHPQQIMVDDIDLRAFDIASWRRQIALVSQDTFLFHSSIRDNLVYGLQRDVSDEELLTVLRRARLEEYVGSLQQGLATEVGDRGVKLSGGERQRMAIARAMLKDAEILLLDEATSALDSITEKLVQEALEELMRGRTTLMIAHRLSTIRNADAVVVLEKGKVVEVGVPAELKDGSGAFARYWKQQQNV